MKKIIYTTIVLVGLLFIAGCNPEDDTKSLWGSDVLIPDST